MQTISVKVLQLPIPGASLAHACILFIISQCSPEVHIMLSIEGILSVYLASSCCNKLATSQTWQETFSVLLCITVGRSYSLATAATLQICCYTNLEKIKARIVLSLIVLVVIPCRVQIIARNTNN